MPRIILAFLVLAMTATAHGQLQSLPPTLRQAAGDHLLVGAAVMSTIIDDPARAALLARQFNCVTDENEFKPAAIEPQPGRFNFTHADRLVGFAEQHQMAMIGHCLCWHDQTPRWFYKAFHALGIKVSITELDIDVLPGANGNADINHTSRTGDNPYPLSCPPAILQQEAQVYGDLFSMLGRHRDAVERVTFWGLDDSHSWLNNYPVRGRTNYPLLWDRGLNTKPAFSAVLDAINAANRSG